MVNLDFLSDNLAIILNEVINNQSIVKYLSYNIPNPISQPDLKLPAKDLINNKVFPFPADPVAMTTDATQLRIYYPKCDFTVDSQLGDVEIYFDIVASNTLWLINDGIKSQIRPYMLVKEIMKHFNNRSITTLGKLHFQGFVHVNVNSTFDCIRLIANMELFGGSDS